MDRFHIERAVVQLDSRSPDRCPVAFLELPRRGGKPKKREGLDNVGGLRASLMTSTESPSGLGDLTRNPSWPLTRQLGTRSNEDVS